MRQATAVRAIVIGGSAGALDVLVVLLRELRPPCPASVIVVVHQLPVMSSLLAQVLAPVSALPVREALDKMPLEPGFVYVAPPDYHLLVEDELTIALSRDPTVHFSRPAIDVTFESCAEAVGPELVGVLLTGANDDGASGLAAIARAGGRVAVQDPETAHATAMPLAGIAACTPDLVADPERIASWLRFLLPPAEDV